MNQLPYWPLASLLLVPVVLYLGLRAYFVLLARFDRERRNVKQISELHLATIEALARAIDAKDGTAENHIRRVQIYATAVARELGMTELEVQAVKTATLLHDIGKLAVPDHILAKPGPLTPEEFQKVQAHPQVGADIIGTVPFPYPVALRLSLPLSGVGSRTKPYVVRPSWPSGRYSVIGRPSGVTNSRQWQYFQRFISSQAHSHRRPFSSSSRFLSG